MDRTAPRSLWIPFLHPRPREHETRSMHVCIHLFHQRLIISHSLRPRINSSEARGRGEVSIHGPLCIGIKLVG